MDLKGFAAAYNLRIESKSGMQMHLLPKQEVIAVILLQVLLTMPNAFYKVRCQDPRAKVGVILHHIWIGVHLPNIINTKQKYIYTDHGVTYSLIIPNPFKPWKETLEGSAFAIQNLGVLSLMMHWNGRITDR